jgi:2-oxoglutarate dehydrogenase E1 component
LRDLAEGSFQFVIDDADAVPEKISRLVLCSGKVYTDLVASPLRASTPTVAIARVEQLYPFRPAKLEAVLSRYLQLTEVVWLQEEPENMGAWETVRPALERLLGERWPLRVLSRPRAASPAEGSSARHAATQKALMEQAYQL